MVDKGEALHEVVHPLSEPSLVAHRMPSAPTKLMQKAPTAALMKTAWAQTMLRDAPEMTGATKVEVRCLAFLATYRP